VLQKFIIFVKKVRERIVQILIHNTILDCFISARSRQEATRISEETFINIIAAF